mgnify:CR=1 FL=1
MILSIAKKALQMLGSKKNEELIRKNAKYIMELKNAQATKWGSKNLLKETPLVRLKQDPKNPYRLLRDK